MKKMNLLLATFVILFTILACENDKDDEPKPEQKVTIEDLKGDWDFVSLEFEGETYYGCDPDLNYNYHYVTLNFYEVTEDEMMLYTDCMDGDEPPSDKVYDYTLEEDIIDCHNGARVFQIMNYDSFDGTVLKVKFIEPYNHPSYPIGGTYTLEKQ